MITTDPLTPALIETLWDRAETLRHLAASPLGRTEIARIGQHIRVLNVFAQPSTRTFLSFESAEALLGMQRLDVRDLATTSTAKGESLEDALRTYCAYCDLLVLRHPDPRAIQLAAEIGAATATTLVNAGSGTRAHPTQALLDVYTLLRHFGTLEGKTLLFAGDLKRGRTVRSLIRVLRQFPVQLVLAAPDHLQLDDDVLAELGAAGVPVRTLDRLDVTGVDAVYLTRVQDEWDGAHEGHPPTDPAFVFDMAALAALGTDSIVLHPLPKRDEITAEVCNSGDPRLKWWEQVENGLWARAALLEHLVG